MVFPGRSPRPFPEKISLLVFDFDGVLTDNRVLVDQDGKETIAASRSDGMGFEHAAKNYRYSKSSLYQKKPIRLFLPDVRNLNIPVFQSVEQKRKSVRRIAEGEKNQLVRMCCMLEMMSMISIVFPCWVMRRYQMMHTFPQKLKADIVLEHAGGYGAVREICEMLIKKFGK